MHEIVPHRAHLEFALNQGETVIFDEATHIEQHNMLILLRDREISGQYDLDGRLHLTNNAAQAKAQRLTELRAELSELAGQPVLTIIRGSKN